MSSVSLPATAICPGCTTMVVLPAEPRADPLICGTCGAEVPDYRLEPAPESEFAVPETEQLLPSTNGYYDIPKNDDGSIDLWFAPTQPEGVVDAAFVQTVPGRDFIVAFRLYGTEHAFYDQTWKPDDLVRVTGESA